jgi:thiosulfate/3-mercaptopyruvate sulfurtransferase
VPSGIHGAGRFLAIWAHNGLNNRQSIWRFGGTSEGIVANATSANALPGTLVTTEWLSEHLGDADLRIVDMRGYVKSRDLGGGHQASEYTGAKAEFDAGHIPGSVYVDWTKDIIDPNDTVPVQIASPEAFAAAMEKRGVGSDSRVIIVDHTGGHFATRLWWALNYYGHDDAAVLDGGFKKWVAEGRLVTTAQSVPKKATFACSIRPELRVDADEVAALSASGEAVIVDARDEQTFTGAVWRGSRKGHIPGAINLAAKSLYESDGTLKSKDVIAEIVEAAGITPETRVVAYCNGGVTATGVLFALDQLGYHNGANYDGSWNEWGERLDLPSETGDRSK